MGPASTDIECPNVYGPEACMTYMVEFKDTIEASTLNCFVLRIEYRVIGDQVTNPLEFDGWSIGSNDTAKFMNRIFGHGNVGRF